MEGLQEGGSSAQAASHLVPFKFTLGKDTRRWTPYGRPTHGELVSRVRTVYELPQDTTVRLKYTDAEGDQVTLASDDDVQELFRQSLSVVRVAVSAPEWAEAKAAASEAKKEAKRLAKEAEKKAAWRAKLTAKAEKGDARAKAKLRELLKKEAAAVAAAREKASSASSSDDDGDDDQFEVGTYEASEERSEKVDRFVQRVVGFAALAEDNDAAFGRVVKMINKFPTKFGVAHEPLLVEALKRETALSSKFGDKLRTLATNPESLELPELPTTEAQATVRRALDNEVKDELPRETAVHPGITCDGCDMYPLRGPRYKSKNRPDFDVCEECKAEGGRYWSKDEFTLIERPCPWRSGSSRQGHGPGRGARHPAGKLGGGGCGGCRPQGRGGPPHGGPGGRGWGHPHHPPPPLGPPWLPFGPPHPMPPPPHFAPTAPPVDFEGLSDGVGEKASKAEARFVQDVTIPDGTELAPGQRVLKTWRLRNSGAVPWNPSGGDILMLHVGGDQLAPKLVTRVTSDAPAPGEELDVAVELVAPEQPGRYVGYFRLAEEGVRKHERFGQRVWASILVPPPPQSPSSQGSERLMKEHSTTLAAYTEAAGLKALPEEYQPPEIVHQVEAAHNTIAESDPVPLSAPVPAACTVGDEWVDVNTALH